MVLNALFSATLANCVLHVFMAEANKDQQHSQFSPHTTLFEQRVSDSKKKLSDDDHFAEAPESPSSHKS